MLDNSITGYVKEVLKLVGQHVQNDLDRIRLQENENVEFKASYAFDVKMFQKKEIKQIAYFCKFLYSIPKSFLF